MSRFRELDLSKLGRRAFVGAAGGSFPQRRVPIGLTRPAAFDIGEQRYRQILGPPALASFQPTTTLADPNVLVENLTVLETNLFSTMGGVRTAPTELSGMLQRAVGVTVQTPTPWLAVAAVEATSPGNNTPRVATTVVSLERPAAPVVGTKRTYAPPSSGPLKIVGGQGCVVRSWAGTVALAAYHIARVRAGESERRILILEIDRTGNVTPSEIAPVLGPGVTEQSVMIAPAIAASSDGSGTVFVAWPMRVGGRAAIQSMVLRRAADGWRPSRVLTTEWPAYPLTDFVDYGFEPNLAADFDPIRSEFVLAALKTQAKPYLARYTLRGVVVGIQSFGEGDCGEDVHGSLELRVHPRTGRALMQLLHNWIYFGPTTGGFQTLDDVGAPIDLRPSRPGAACNVVFPFSDLGPGGGTRIRSIGEQSTIGLGAVRDSEFAVTGPDDRMSFAHAVTDTYMLNPRADIHSVRGGWRGHCRAQALGVIESHRANIILAQQQDELDPADPTSPILMGIVK